MTTPFKPTIDREAHLSDQLERTERGRRMMVDYSVDAHRHLKGVIDILDRVGGYHTEEDQNTLRAARIFLHGVVLR